MRPTRVRAGFADGATERVFVGTTLARRIETRRAFVGLRPIRAVFVGGLDNAIEQGFFRSSVGIGDGRVGHGAVRAERADRRAHKSGMRYYISGTLSLVSHSITGAWHSLPLTLTVPILMPQN